MTAFEHWKASPDDQKIAETFFKSDTGRRLLAVLRERNQLAASPLSGIDGIHEDSKTLQRWDGYERCLAVIPTLFHTMLSPMQGQQLAREQLEAQARERRMMGAQPTPPNT